MTLPVSLKDVVEHMDMIGYEISAYINRKTGELVSLTSQDISLAEDDDDGLSVPDWQKEIVEKAGQVMSNDDFIELPDTFDINEYAIMERYCDTIEDERVRHGLLKAMSGKGAFRRFKDDVREAGIENDWYQYRDEAFRKIAAEFLRDNGIAFVNS